LHFNKGLAGAPPEHITAATNTATTLKPVAFALAIIADGGPPVYPGLPHAPSADVDAARRSRQQVSRLCGHSNRRPMPARSAEAIYSETTWRGLFGAIATIDASVSRKRVRPRVLFFVHHGVGSDGGARMGLQEVGRG